MKPDRKIVGGNPIITGLELKDLSDAITKTVTMIKLVENNKVIDVEEYVKSHGQAAATTACHCKNSDIEVSNRTVTMDCLFENMRCAELLK